MNQDMIEYIGTLILKDIVVECKRLDVMMESLNTVEALKPIPKRLKILADIAEMLQRSDIDEKFLLIVIERHMKYYAKYS